MAKLKILIDDSIICSLSQMDFDNLKLLQACLPEKNKEDLSDLELKSINDYNNFLDEIIQKNKGKALMIDCKLYRR